MGITGRNYLLKILLFTFIFIFLIYWFFQWPYIKKKTYPLYFEEKIFEYSQHYQLDPHLIMSIIWVESKFKPEATSRKDARGLMQILPRTGQWIAEQIGITDYDHTRLYEPDVNIMMGCWYIDYLIDIFGEDIELTLAAYNGGMGNVMKWLKDSRYSQDGVSLSNIPFQETRQYIEKVQRVYKHYKKLYEI